MSNVSNTYLEIHVYRVVCGEFEPFLKGLCHTPPPFIPFLSFGGGQGWQFALSISPYSSFLCVSHFSGRPRDLV